MKRLAYAQIGFFLGLATAGNTLGVAQDIMGLEGWMAFQRRHWDPASFTWPLEGLIFLCLMIGIVGITWKARREDRELPKT